MIVSNDLRRENFGDSSVVSTNVKQKSTHSSRVSATGCDGGGSLVTTQIDKDFFSDKVSILVSIVNQFDQLVQPSHNLQLYTS